VSKEINVKKCSKSMRMQLFMPYSDEEEILSKNIFKKRFLISKL